MLGILISLSRFRSGGAPLKANIVREISASRRAPIRGQPSLTISDILGTTSYRSQFCQRWRVIGGDVHRVLSAVLLTGAAIYTAKTFLLGAKRNLTHTIRPLNTGYHSLSKALLDHARGERASAISKALNEVNRLRDARRETHSQIKRMAKLTSANWQTLLNLRQGPSL
jgi:hypothetical protein